MSFVKSLERIRSNDPCLEHLSLYKSELRSLDNFEIAVIGDCIAQNTSIKSLSLNGFNVNSTYWEAFFSIVSRSKSIGDVGFINCTLDNHILKLFEMSTLHKVRFSHTFTITHQTLSAIQNASNLQYVTLDDINIGDAVMSSGFIRSLNHHHQLESLEMYGGDILDSGWNAIGEILSDPSSIIKVLKLKGLKSSYLSLLQNGLRSSSSLQELMLSDSRVDSCHVIAEMLSSPHTTLRLLDLYKCSVDNTSANVLATGLTQNSTLEVLNFYLSLFDITEEGLSTIMASLKNSAMPLKRLYLSENDISDYDGLALGVEIGHVLASSLADSLAMKNNTIEEIHLDCPNMTSTGWVKISTAFLTCMPNLTKLKLENSNCDGNANFDEVAVNTIFNGLHNMPALMELYLSGVILTGAGLEGFSNSLCDSTSLHTIKSSHHSLFAVIIEDEYGRIVDMPNHIDELLAMNEYGSKADAICLKIIKYYNGVNMEALVSGTADWQTKLAPFVMACLGTKHGLTALYRFTRNESAMLERVNMI